MVAFVSLFLVCEATEWFFFFLLSRCEYIRNKYSYCNLISKRGEYFFLIDCYSVVVVVVLVVELATQSDPNAKTEGFLFLSKSGILIHPLDKKNTRYQLCKNRKLNVTGPIHSSIPRTILSNR